MNKQHLRPCSHHRNHVRMGDAMSRLWLSGWGKSPGKSKDILRSADWGGGEVQDFGHLSLLQPRTHTWAGFWYLPEAVRSDGKPGDSLTTSSPSAACCLHDHLHLCLPIPIVPLFLITVSSIFPIGLLSDLWSPSVASSFPWNLALNKHHKPVTAFLFVVVEMTSVLKLFSALSLFSQLFFNPRDLFCLLLGLALFQCFRRFQRVVWLVKI
jgi:hypothetical protein